MIGAPCQSSNSLTRTRTLSSRQIRQRGSLRSKSVLRGSAALVIVLIRESSRKGVTSPSDTDMAFPPRSGERARWLMGSFSQNETCCATRKKRQAWINAKSHLLHNDAQFLCFCGTSLSLGSHCCLTSD